jgi:Ca-activated chloride channel family protein
MQMLKPMNREELERAIEEIHPSCFGWALACCRWNREEAEDVLQTSYLKALDGRISFNGHSSVRTWMFGVVRNTASERRRYNVVRILGLSRFVRTASAAEQPPTPESAANDRENHERLRRMLDRLSSRQRDLLHLDSLEAGGSTNGGEGLRLAYQVAREHFVQGGVNRVVLATDGDFNVGITDQAELTRFVEEQARRGVALTALGFGTGDYKDDTLERLADRGDGNYAYIESLQEARKVLVEQIGGTLVTIAKDVKIQVEFNPRMVGAYRLIGYENRVLRKEDFADDRKDAGEIGSGHTVTALYEIVPPDQAADLPTAEPLKYQRPSEPSQGSESGEALTLKLRYKEPDGEISRLLSYPITDAGYSMDQASEDFRFAAAVAAFGMILRDSPHKGTADLDQVARLARAGMGSDEGGYRSGFVDLVDLARKVSSP